MIKLATFFKRRPGMDVEGFQAEWAAAGSALRIPGLRGYAQSAVIPSGYRKGEPFCDGIAEYWWDDLAALEGSRGTRESAEARAAAEALRDPSSFGSIVTVEHVIKNGPVPPAGVKNVEFVRRRPDLAPEEFHRYWREHHGPLASRIAPLRRYVQSHSIEDPATRRWDGIASTWFDDTNGMRDSAKTVEYRETRDDEHHFVIEPLPFVITRETVRKEGRW